MNVEHVEQGAKGAFVLVEANEHVGEMTYSKAGSNLLIIDHTEVADKLRGQGAGKNLVLEAVAYARKNNLKILPLCPFAKAVFNRSPELHDVLNT
ncbi:MAG: N-acetyltransferase [Cyclobacteriaceae bacterium]|nr:N-acetyltransferase [Cyclobacteriaceae bacterium]